MNDEWTFNLDQRMHFVSVFGVSIEMYLQKREGSSRGLFSVSGDFSSIAFVVRTASICTELKNMLESSKDGLKP